MNVERNLIFYKEDFQIEKNKILEKKIYADRNKYLYIWINYNVNIKGIMEDNEKDDNEKKGKERCKNREIEAWN